MGVGSAIRAKKLPGPLAIGPRDSLSLWATSRLCRPVQDLLAGKRALLEFTLSPKATTPGPWKNQPLATRIEQKKEASRSPVSPLREINIWNFLFTCSSCLFWKGNWEVGIVWPNLVGRGTIPAGPSNHGSSKFVGELTIG